MRVSLQHYRYWVVWRCPTVRFLDYQKVKQAEREKAAELFGTADEPTELASNVRTISLLLHSSWLLFGGAHSSGWLNDRLTDGKRT